MAKLRNHAPGLKLLGIRSTWERIRQRVVPKDAGTFATSTTMAQPEPQSGFGLSVLPPDIILDIVMFLGPLDKYRISQTSRLFYQISQDPLIWERSAQDFMRVPRLLVLDDISVPLTLTVNKLKRALIRSDMLHEAWGPDGERVTLREPIYERTQLGPIPRNNRIPSYPADTFTVIPHDPKFLDGLRVMLGKSADWARQNHVAWPIGDIQVYPQYQSGSYFVTFGSGVPDLGERGYFLSLSLCPISLPSTLPQRSVSQFVYSYYGIPGVEIIEQLIDSTNKRTFTLYTLPSDGILRVNVILDWKSSRRASLATGLKYRHGVVATGIRLGRGDSEFDVCTDDHNVWCLETYSISQLMGRASTSEDVDPVGQGYLQPKRSLTRNFDSWVDPTMTWTPLLSIDKYWTIAQPVQYGGSPSLYCHIRLYRPIYHNIWKVSQFYTDEDGLRRSARFLCSLTDPALQTRNTGKFGLPLMGVSFTHVAWVEAVDTTTQTGTTRTKRVLKLATFSRSKASANSSAGELQGGAARTLDIPGRVLENACVICIEPALASIYIMTETSELHKFQYA